MAVEENSSTKIASLTHSMGRLGDLAANAREKGQQGSR
jgi:hypothetical protein